MEFKKSYRFIDFLPFVIMLGILFVAYIIMITFIIIDGLYNDRFNEVIIVLIPCVILFVGTLVIILILCQCVTIDEQKIEIKDLRGTILSFCINDIYKIEKRPGPKGSLVFVIHGNTPQIHSRKSKVKTINIGADKKREQILRHFITNPDVWDTEI